MSMIIIIIMIMIITIIINFISKESDVSVPVQSAPGACTEWLKTKYADANNYWIHLLTCRHTQAHAHTRKHALTSHERTNIIGKNIILYKQITEISRHGHWEVEVALHPTTSTASLEVARQRSHTLQYSHHQKHGWLHTRSCQESYMWSLTQLDAYST